MHGRVGEEASAQQTAQQGEPDTAGLVAEEVGPLRGLEPPECEVVRLELRGDEPGKVGEKRTEV